MGCTAWDGSTGFLCTARIRPGWFLLIHHRHFTVLAVLAVNRFRFQEKYYGI